MEWRKKSLSLLLSSSYPTIIPVANLVVATFAESIKDFHDHILKMANGNEGAKEPVQMLIPSLVFAPSPITEDDIVDTPTFQQIAAPRLSIKLILPLC